MSLKTELSDALKEAMKANDAMRKSTLRGALAAIKQLEIDDRRDLEEADILRILQKEVKSRRETIADAEKAERADMIEEAKSEIEILEAFLPKGLSPEELKAIIEESIAEVGAESMADMGNVMKAVLPKVQGRADGGQISQIVRQLLGA